MCCSRPPPALGFQRRGLPNLQIHTEQTALTMCAQTAALKSYLQRPSSHRAEFWRAATSALQSPPHVPLPGLLSQKQTCRPWDPSSATRSLGEAVMKQAAWLSGQQPYPRMCFGEAERAGPWNMKNQAGGWRTVRESPRLEGQKEIETRTQAEP